MSISSLFLLYHRPSAMTAPNLKQVLVLARTTERAVTRKSFQNGDELCHRVKRVYMGPDRDY